ncbi:MAG: peptidase [Phycisphaerales bacterium]|nr:peptidase [Phycisphaerales bacterium]
MDPSHFEHRVKALEAFGHRGSASAHEHRAAQYLAGELRQLGVEPTIKDFLGARSLAARLFVHVLVAALGAALLWRMPLVTVICAVGALVSLVVEQTKCVVWLSWPVCQYRSHNVWARIPPVREARRRILLCAHYDTQHSGVVWTINRYLMPLANRSPLLLKPPMLPVVGLMSAQILLGVLRLVPGPSLPITPLNIALLLAYVVLSLLFVQWALGRPVPGAADNASGVAAVLELAERWLRNPPTDDVELIVLLPGCEESGMLGAAAWADRHRQDLATLPTAFLNIDAVGFGPPRFLGTEVPVAGLPIRSDAKIIGLSAQAATEAGLIDAGPHTLPGPTDGLAFLARRIPGITVVGFRDGGVLPNYHTFADTSANMDFAAARAGVDFAELVCRKLALMGIEVGEGH